MPLYDYQCDECGHLFEVDRKRTDPHPDVCPSCNAASPRRAVSAPSFRLSGSGWYVTDYDGRNPSTQAKHSPTPAESGETSGGSTESAPVSSSESSAPSTTSSEVN